MAEVHWNDCFAAEFDESEWDHAVLTEALDTEYCLTDCPTDTLIEELPVKRVGTGNVYDCGQNTTGYPVLKVTAQK